MAKRRSGYVRDSSNLFEATDDEYFVASILLELCHPKAESVSRPRFPLSWGAKKKRRFTDETPPQRRLPLPSLPLPPPPPPPPPQPVATLSFQESGFSGPEGDAALKAEAASSPASPLSFSPSESDENPKHLKRKLSEKKQTIKEWLDTIEEVTKSNKFFEEEMEKLKSYYEELKAKNLRLKARKQELMHSNGIGKIRLEASNSNSTGLRFEMKLGQTTIKSTFPTDNQDHHLSHIPGIVVHQSSVIVNQTATIPEPSDYYYAQQCGRMQSSHTSGGGLGHKSIDDVCPLGIPDLNLSPVDSLWTDSDLPSSSIDNKSFTRAVAAQARHRRMQICRDKNSGASNKLRISLR
uniref:Uncharacterized protein n=1 Tax=Rhizophora mucronata TaxID=61149 RepID=A0A2P2ILS3_RHIMU